MSFIIQKLYCKHCRKEIDTYISFGTVTKAKLRWKCTCNKKNYDLYDSSRVYYLALNKYMPNKRNKILKARNKNKYLKKLYLTRYFK